MSHAAFALRCSPLGTPRCLVDVTETPERVHLHLGALDHAVLAQGCRWVEAAIESLGAHRVRVHQPGTSARGMDVVDWRAWISRVTNAQRRASMSMRMCFNDEAQALARVNRLRFVMHGAVTTTRAPALTRARQEEGMYLFLASWQLRFGTADPEAWA